MSMELEAVATLDDDADNITGWCVLAYWED